MSDTENVVPDPNEYVQPKDVPEGRITGEGSPELEFEQENTPNLETAGDANTPDVPEDLPETD